MGRRGTRDRSDEGAAAVEFALVLPILLMVVFGIINFGVVFAQSLAVGNAAREAARFGAVEGPTCADIEDKATEIGKQTIAPGQMENEAFTGCSGTPPCEGSAEGATVEVTLSYDSRLLVPIPIWGMPETVGIEGQGEFRCEFS